MSVEEIAKGEEKLARKRSRAAKKAAKTRAKNKTKASRKKKKGQVRKTPRRTYVKKKGGTAVATKRKTGRGWWGDTSGHTVAHHIGRAGMKKGRAKTKSGRRKRRTYVKSRVGGLGKIRSYRKRRKITKGRKTPLIRYRQKIGKRRVSLVANRSTRKGMRRKTARRAYKGLTRDRRGRFLKKRGTRAGMRRKTARRAYQSNPRRRRTTRKGMRRRTARRAYRRNPGIAAGFVESLTAPFDLKFVTETALPVTGGFLLSRFASGMIGGGILGTNYKGPVRIAGNFVAAGLTGFAAGFIAQQVKIGNPTQIRGNVILGGMVNAVAGLIKYVLTDVMPVAFITESPALSSAFGLSGLGYDNSEIRSAVQREVMKELGVSDYLTSQDLGKAQYMGDYLTTQNLAKAQPNTMSGMGDQWFPAEANGGALADFSDVATF